MPLTGLGSSLEMPKLITLCLKSPEFLNFTHSGIGSSLRKARDNQIFLQQLIGATRSTKARVTKLHANIWPFSSFFLNAQ